MKKIEILSKPDHIGHSPTYRGIKILKKARAALKVSTDSESTDSEKVLKESTDSDSFSEKETAEVQLTSNLTDAVKHAVKYNRCS